MLGFVQSWFAPPANPVGVDFGSDALRMAQVEPVAAPGGGAIPGEFRLAAAARADVPSHLRNDPAARMEFFAQAARELWSRGAFRGRRVVLSLPASIMSVRHLRLPRMEDDALKKALVWEASGKLPYDPTRAVLRHLVAGEIYQDGEQKNEVILLAANRDFVNQYLAAAAKARLDVVGMNVEPKAIVDCFTHLYRRKGDTEATNCFVDLGCCASRAVIARGGQILFARVIPVGGEHFTRAVAAALKVSADDARILRAKLCHAQSAGRGDAAGQERRQGIDAAADSAPEPDLAPPQQQEMGRVDEACREPLAKLVEELALCRRYHEATFPNLPVTRLVFVGGEARHRGLCRQIARGLDLAAQLGDPMVRMGRISEVGAESGIDRRQPQPDWSVAIGLSMGPAVAPAPGGAEPAGEPGLAPAMAEAAG